MADRDSFGGTVARGFASIVPGGRFFVDELDASENEARQRTDEQNRIINIDRMYNDCVRGETAKTMVRSRSLSGINADIGDDASRYRASQSGAFRTEQGKTPDSPNSAPGPSGLSRHHAPVASPADAEAMARATCAPILEGRSPNQLPVQTSSATEGMLGGATSGGFGSAITGSVGQDQEFDSFVRQLLADMK